MKNNILEIKIGNTTFTVEAKNAEISTITTAEALKQQSNEKIFLDEQSERRKLIYPIEKTWERVRSKSEKILADCFGYKNGF